jgi:hypothetical protein
MSVISGRDADELFRALDAELGRIAASPIGLCVIGGAALNMAGFVSRPTKDIDVLGIIGPLDAPFTVTSARPMPASLAAAADEVARQFLLEPGWLNAGPTDLLDHGLPTGFETRLTAETIGPHLRIHFAGRLDQICFKTYAAADVAGRHLTDLLGLEPTPEEMGFAFRWAVAQDPSDAFRLQLSQLAQYMGVPHVLGDIEG